MEKKPVYVIPNTRNEAWQKVVSLFSANQLRGRAHVPKLCVKWSAVYSASPLPLSISSAITGEDPGNRVPPLDRV